MEPFFIAMAVIGMAELGDKTQLLALVLANRTRRPLAVAAGMVIALLLMHSLAAFTGAALDRFLPDRTMNWAVGIGFVGMALWMARSRGHSESEVEAVPKKRNAFLTALMVFCLLEFGDKSQLATVGLSIALEPTWLVGLGAAAGGIAVNLPVIWLGYKLQRRIPDLLCHWLASLLFLLVGLWILTAQIQATLQP